MPTISAFYGLLIQMFYRDHLPPHFHIKYAGSQATFDIQKLVLMNGNLPVRELRLVSEWAKLHQDELLDNWGLCETMQAPKPIAPLR
ncbi:DUF4160 domain-containing protein [Duganella sp. PWIR1]